MNLSELATAELSKPVKERDYELIELDRERWHIAVQWLRTKARFEVRELLVKMGDEERDDMRRRLNKIAGFER